MIKVLVVDDSPLVRKLFRKVLTDTPGFEVAFARDGVEALDKLDTCQPDVITLDVNMPQMNGLDCLDRIMVQRPCPVVMVSSVTEEGAEAALKALRLGAVDFVAKPTGAVSLHIDSFAPTFLEKIRAAASAKLPASKRLRERVQMRSGRERPSRARTVAVKTIEAEACAADGEGLVLVGISTGGPPALETLLGALPQTFSWPILVAQHMPAGFTAAFAKRLDAMCALDVVEAARPMPIRPGCVYIGRGDADLIVSRRSAGLVAMAAPAQATYLWHPSADRLVRSAMTHLPATQLIGVLMTGMGNDGVQAMTELRAKGGKTIAEAEETAVVWGMPGELVKAGGADWVLPLRRIADRLCKLVPSDASET